MPHKNFETPTLESLESVFQNWHSLITKFMEPGSLPASYPLPEQRVQTQKTHFRVPDVTVLHEGSKREPVLTYPPFLIVEVQSPDQPLRRTEAKAIEYLNFGVEHVWVVDPYAA